MMRNDKTVLRLVKTQSVIADQCHVAVSFVDRTRGLIGRKSMQPGEAMLFPRCNSIHMWFMSIAIDVVFLKKLSHDGPQSAVWKVLSVHESVPAWKFFPLSDWSSSDTLELPEGTVRRLGILPGDEICTS